MILCAFTGVLRGTCVVVVWQKVEQNTGNGSHSSQDAHRATFMARIRKHKGTHRKTLRNEIWACGDGRRWSRYTGNSISKSAFHLP